MRARAALAIGASVLVIAVGLGGCAKSDEQVPTGPGVSRAEPTGTVDTTVPTTAKKG